MKKRETVRADTLGCLTSYVPSCILGLTFDFTSELNAKKASKFVFEGDGEEDVLEFKQDGADEGSDDEDEQGPADEEDDDGPEDDFNAAWEVLDLARALYEKKGDSDEMRLKVADTYIALGDVSLETGTSNLFFQLKLFLNNIFLRLDSQKSSTKPSLTLQPVSN